MPSKKFGLTQSSNLIVIGANVDESAPNTFTEARIDLQLNPLDNEVFVVQAVNLEVATPEAIAATDTARSLAMTTTSQTGMPNISGSNVIATVLKQIRSSGYLDGGVGFTSTSMDTPPTELGYLAIIATNDFFLQTQGTNNVNAGRGQAKVYGYRARADASVYAALVQSEVLSA